MAAAELCRSGYALARRQWPIAAVLFALLVVDVAAEDGWSASFAVLLAQMVATSALAVLSVLRPGRAAAAAALVVAGGTVLLWQLGSPGIGLHAASLTSVIVIVVEAIGSMPARGAVAATGVLGISAAVQFAVLGRSAPLQASEILGFGSALCLSAVLAGLFLRGLAADRARAAAAQVAGARENERLAMAREVHDVVAHHLTSIVVVANAERWSNRDAVRREFLDQVIREGTDALEATRHLVQTLRSTDEPQHGARADTGDDPGHERPGAPAGPDRPDTDLADTLREVAARCAVPVEIVCTPPRLPPDLRRSVVRIVTEALTNVSKHAVGATGARVEIGAAEPGAAGRRGIAVVVTDDGRGGRPAGGPGYGIVGMSERAELHGGSLQAGRCATGWRVDARIPWGRR